MIPRSLSLTRAVADGNTEAVRDLLAQGADANRTTSGGQTPLILAIVFRHIHILRLLLEAGADPQLRDSLGLNAIDWAQRKGFTEGVTLLAQSRSAKHDTSLSVHSTEPTVPNRSVSPNVEKENPQPGKAPGQMRSDEKTRQWIAGLKRRFDEEAGRKAKEVQPTPPPPTTETKASRVPVNDSPIRASTRPPEPLVMPEKVMIAPPPDSLTNVATDTSQPKAGIISPETSSTKAITSAADSERKPQRPPSSIDPRHTSSSRKRCPKCNAIYNSELLAYCAVDMTPLVDANQPVVTSPPATATTTLIWLLVISTFVAVAATTYVVSDYLSKVERVSAPTVAEPPRAADVKSELPVVGSELAGKALTLPGPEYPPTAKSEGVGGTILVRVKVDRKGRVISARSFEGDWRLRAAAIKAATKATFSAEKLSGREASGTIIYTFKP